MVQGETPAVAASARNAVLTARPRAPRGVALRLLSSTTPPPFLRRVRQSSAPSPAQGGRRFWISGRPVGRRAGFSLNPKP